MKIRGSGCCAALAALVLACSSDPSTAPPAPAAPATSPAEPVARPEDPPPSPEAPEGGAPDRSAQIAAFDAALAKATCTRLSACCDASEYEAFFAVYGDKPYDLKAPPPASECEATLAAQLGIVHQKWAGAISRGNMEMTATEAQKCLDLVGNAACGVELTKALYASGCYALRRNPVFRKTGKPGSACKADLGDGTYNGECDPDLGYCGADGQCKAWSKPGEDCTAFKPWRFCAPSSDCLGGRPPTKPGEAAVPGKCSKPAVVKGLGESCDTLADGTPVVCTDETWCDLFGTKKCEAKKADGAACAFDSECASGHPYSCSPYGNGTCGQTSHCDGGRR